MFVVQLLHDFYTKQQLNRNAHVSVIAQLFRNRGSISLFLFSYGARGSQYLSPPIYFTLHLYYFITRIACLSTNFFCLAVNRGSINLHKPGTDFCSSFRHLFLQPFARFWTFDILILLRIKDKQVTAKLFHTISRALISASYRGRCISLRFLRSNLVLLGCANLSSF